MFIYCSESFFPPFLTHLYPCIAMPKFRLALMMQLHPCDHVTADLIVAIIKPEVFSAYCTLASGDVGPDGCRNRSVGFVLPVFSALGVSVRLAAFPPPLSIYNWAAATGQMSPSRDSASPFVIAELDDCCACLYEREKQGKRS